MLSRSARLCFLSHHFLYLQRVPFQNKSRLLAWHYKNSSPWLKSPHKVVFLTTSQSEPAVPAHSGIRGSILTNSSLPKTYCILLPLPSNNLEEHIPHPPCPESCPSLPLEVRMGTTDPNPNFIPCLCVVLTK